MNTKGIISALLMPSDKGTSENVKYVLFSSLCLRFFQFRLYSVSQWCIRGSHICVRLTAQPSSVLIWREFSLFPRLRHIAHYFWKQIIFYFFTFFFERFLQLKPRWIPFGKRNFYFMKSVIPYVKVLFRGIDCSCLRPNGTELFYLTAFVVFSCMLSKLLLNCLGSFWVDFVSKHVNDIT